MAHTYSTDSNERQSVPFFIAVLAVMAAFAVANVFDRFQYSPPWWMPTVDPIVFYGLFYVLFDRVIWKWPVTHRLRISRVPDLSGTWRGHVQSSHAGDGNGALGPPVPVTVRIRQTWTRIYIVLESAHSKSYSLSGSVLVQDACRLTYEFRNEPTPGAVAAMNVHYGTARLELESGGNQLTGDYYSGRGRQNHGTLEVIRQVD